jgi:hypothetical protein
VSQVYEYRFNGFPATAVSDGAKNRFQRGSMNMILRTTTLLRSCAILGAILAVAAGATANGSLKGSAGDAQRLAKYKGHYPSELFRKEPALKQRLRKLLGTRYQFFSNRLQTEVPIENDGGVLIVQGCEAHQCTIEVSILAIELDADKLHVAIKSSEFRNTYKLWNEDGSQVPNALRKAMQDASP